MPDSPPDPTLCHRCGALLPSGSGAFYVVRIEAFADPSPPRESIEASPATRDREIDRLIAQMREMSTQELMDDVYRKITVHLCRACYLSWIENPVG
ncbi:MAG: hypothetical protein HKO59_13350 [Phycisphaerales bacterium]|nr:hypothetical protein [Phycisphaerales bacterium]NNM26948.1 hypothetical protein [Phycisphaerales bacterium]